MPGPGPSRGDAAKMSEVFTMRAEPDLALRVRRVSDILGWRDGMTIRRLVAEGIDDLERRALNAERELNAAGQ